VYFVPTKVKNGYAKVRAPTAYGSGIRFYSKGNLLDRSAISITGYSCLLGHEKLERRLATLASPPA
jgi:hypothetical protein